MLLENCGYPEDTRVRLEAESLASAGYSVSVICPTGDRSQICERIGEVQVYRYPGPFEFGGLLGYAYEYAYSILMQWVLTCWVYLRRGFDIIHLHAPPDMNAVIPCFFRLLGKRFVYDMHDLSPELYQAQRPGKSGKGVVFQALLLFERLAVRFADRLIATNQTQQNVQIRRGGADAKNCYMVRNGPSDDFLGHVDSGTELRDLGHQSPLLIGYVGMMGFQDGIDYLIRSFHHLRFSLGCDCFRAVLVGDGPAFESIRELTSELNLADIVEFTGMVPPEEVPSLIEQFDICTTPDPSNAYNDSCTTIKTMEYMALSKPSVCFETPENAKTAGDSALYAADNDVADFARKLKELLDDSQLREQMGCAARTRVENGLTWPQQSKQLIQLYDEMRGIGDEVLSSAASAGFSNSQLATHIRPRETCP